MIRDGVLIGNLNEMMSFFIHERIAEEHIIKKL